MTMTDQLPALVLLTPFFTAFLALLLGLRYPSLSWPIAVLGLIGTLIATVATAAYVATYGIIEYNLGGWNEHIGIVIIVDELSATVLVLIAAVSWKVLVM